MRKIFPNGLAIFALMMVLGLTAMTQGNVMKDDNRMKDDKMREAKPVVAIIRADWCPACQKIEPFMKELMKEYDGRLNFVVLDVTNDAKAKESEMIAAKNGLTEFFNTYKEKTSTIVVFDAKQKQLFKTDHNYVRDTYVKAFDEALAKHKMMKG
jgi:thiol-disulfide isomerase/thioredoxin